jgi:fructose-specific phosphotransferase system component IIB|tara:strand:+ start:304 stop:795 length:492 start_codon:yes stop_codon:yes gene_type:complete
MSHDDIVSRIKDKLGEFNGYDTLENRNSSDDVIRGFIKDEMTNTVEIFKEHLEKFSNLNNNKKLVADTVIKKINSIIENADKKLDNDSFFSDKQIDENQITTLLTMDSNLTSKSTAVKEKMIRVSREIATTDSWDREVDEVYAKIKELGFAVERRTKFITNIA